MKKTGRIWIVILMCVTLLLSFSAVSVFADEQQDGGTGYQETATLALRNGLPQASVSEFDSFGVVYTLMKAGKLVQAESPEGMESLQVYENEAGEEVFYFEETTARYAYAEGYKNISYDISDEVRTAMQQDLTDNGDQYSEAQKAIIQDIIDHYKTVELTFGDVTYLIINIDGSGIGNTTYAYEEDELSYEEDDLAQSSYIPYIGTYKVGAVASEGSVFVKWLKDGKDYSTDPEITVTLDDQNVELRAVFEAIPPVIDDEEEETPVAAPEEPAAKDQKDASVKTGDETNTLPAALVLTGSVLTLAGYLFGRRRKGQQQ